MDIQRGVVVGTGVMGSGIAQALALAGLDIACVDVSPEQLERARQSIEGGRFGLARAVERGKVSAEQADAARGRLRFTTELPEATADADIVLECVPENYRAKLALFARLDELAPAPAILASNSSGLSIEALAAVTKRPELVIGWHWASPAVVMRMAEIVQAPGTAEATVAVVRELAVRCGKNPVVVRDNPTVWGYAANRVWAALFREARAVVDEGVVDAEGLDQLLVDGWGWPVGPFAMHKGASEGWDVTGWKSSVSDLTAFQVR